MLCDRVQPIHTFKPRDFCADIRSILALKLSYLSQLSLEALMMLDFNTITKGELRADVMTQSTSFLLHQYGLDSTSIRCY